MLEFNNITFKYNQDNYIMVNGLSFKIDDGDFISIIGASGCGKSTIFRLINGLEKPQSGKILVNGRDINEIKNYSAYMPQKDLLFPWLTIKKNVSLPMELQGISKEEIEKKSYEILKDVGLSEYCNKYPKDLSGGMKQRVSFARTLLTGSELLLLDEPFSALDFLTRISLQEWLLKEWKKYKKTILFVTHDVEEAIFISKKIFLITQKPITSFEEYIVPLSYPRSRLDLKREDVIELKEELINKLRQEERV